MENLKLTLPQAWVGRILQIMAKQPYDQVADMIDGIKSQISQQLGDPRQQGNGTADTTTSTVQ
jgi:hypothetical protein